jgi:hypothetical protein
MMMPGASAPPSSYTVTAMGGGKRIHPIGSCEMYGVLAVLDELTVNMHTDAMAPSKTSREVNESC